MRIWISATCLSKSRAIDDWPSSFTQCIFVSTRLRRWHPLHRRHRVRPRYRCALMASLRAIAPSLVGFQGFAFLRGGITAQASRAAMFAGVPLAFTFGYDPCAINEEIQSPRETAIREAHVRPCCIDRRLAGTDAVCSHQDVVNATQVQR